MPERPAPAVPVETVIADLQERVRVRLREDLLRHGASRAFEDPELFASVEGWLREAAGRNNLRALLLPELLGDPAGWRIQPALTFQSHRGPLAGTLVRGFKQQILMPALRWLFEYSHDNFVRQQRVNHILFACVQELAIQNAQLRRDLDRSTPDPGRVRHPESR